jgi:hypothetical protein
MLRRALVLCLCVGALVVPGTAGADVAAFYYPWYGNPSTDGRYLHWNQRGYFREGQLASAYFPSRGLYSSGDLIVVRAQMAELRAAGVDQVVTSWWGRGSVEDERLPTVLAEASAAGLLVAPHVEPYPGRTPESVADDVAYFRSLGISEVYVYGVELGTATAWRALTDAAGDMRLLGQSGRVGLIADAGFDGIYTYDVLVYGGHKFARMCDQARRRQLLCAPSVGPGYDARRAVADRRVKDRRHGATYDTMWRAALRAGADRITITSYNEWHEGTQIEPAREHRGPRGGRYAGYDGAWGLRGELAERAYLDRTGWWASRFREELSRRRS